MQNHDQHNILDKIQHPLTKQKPTTYNTNQQKTRKQNDKKYKNPPPKTEKTHTRSKFGCVFIFREVLITICYFKII